MTKSKKNICTRYAPSPTGELHIGGARTALFNYLFAKRNNGKFILRIEDTDEARNVKNGALIQEEGLKWLNIFPDESFSIPGISGPYLQSQKLSRYQELAYKLVSEKKAYFCFCTAQELEESRISALNNNSTPIYSKKCRFLSEADISAKLKENQEFTIRLKSNNLEIEHFEWDDLIRGKISVPVSSMGDFIILRSNKKPTYNFAVVIDDYDMNVNYVLRGEEHIPNTPYQLAVFNALGWKDNIPNFGHLSVIVDEDKRKLSKRSGNEYHFISTFQKKGYPSQAVLNYLALLGWSYQEREIYSIGEMIQYFDLKNLSSAAAFFDIDKLNWVSHKYFQDMSENYYLNFINPFFTVDLGEYNDKKNLFALTHKNNIFCASQLNEYAVKFFENKEFPTEKLEFLKKNKKLIQLAYKYFPSENEFWDSSTIRNYLKQLLQISEASGKNFFKPLRIAFSFEEEGMELNNLMMCLGRSNILKNLKTVLENLKNE